MRHAKVAILAVLVAGFGVNATVRAQSDSIIERKGLVNSASRSVRLNDFQKSVRAALGQPKKGAQTLTWSYDTGVEVGFDATGKVTQITLRAPFPGATERRVTIGTSAKALFGVHPELRVLKAGWNQAEKVAFGLDRADGKVTAIAVNGRALVENQGDVVGPPPTDPRRDERRPPRNDAGGRDNDPASGRRPDPPRDDVDPGRPDRPREGPQDGSRGRPQERPGRGVDRITVVDSTVEATQQGGVVIVPLERFPANEGTLLIRVGMNGRTTCEQNFCNTETGNTKARDYIYAADFLERFRRPGRPQSWTFTFTGRGPTRLQILWFRDRRDLDRWTQTQPFDFSPAIPERPVDPREAYERDARRIELVFDHSWEAGRELRWFPGPRTGFDDRNGVLLVRPRGGRRVSRFLWRNGGGPAQEVALQDLIIDPASFGRERPSNPLDRLLGNGRRERSSTALDFAFLGYGAVRVQVYWLPDRRIASQWCNEHPLERIGFWNSDLLDPDDFVFGRGSDWRQREDFDSPWNKARFDGIDAGAINLASRRNGASIFRSSRDRTNSQGNEFDGGIWYSEPGRAAWTMSRFYAPSRVSRIDIATAGASRREARYVSIELQDESGVWRRQAVLSEENVNWLTVEENRRSVSRPFLQVPCRDERLWIAFRIVIVGRGPFRAGDIRVQGQPVGAPFADDRDDRFADPIALIEVDSRRGWVDSGYLALPGVPLLIDVEGDWTTDSASESDWYRCGCEGYADNLVLAILGAARARDGRGRRPLPTAPLGALVGRFDDGPPFAIVPGRPFESRSGGRLYLCCNDDQWNDNSGSLYCTLLGGASANQPPIDQPATIVRFRGRLVSDQSNRPLPGVDVIVQMESWPRTIFGGARTDGEGIFDFEVVVPPGAALVVRVPEFRQESLPRSFRGGETFDQEFRLR